MAKQQYKLKNSDTEFHVTDADQILVVADLQDQLAAVQEIRNLDDSTRTILTQCGLPGLGIAGGYIDLQSFDDQLDDDYERLADTLDYLSYDTKVINTTVLDGYWLTPVAVESVSDENVGEETPFAIDGVNSTWWQSDAYGTRTIVFQLRDYKKRISGVRLRATSGDLRSQIQGVDIRCAVTIANLDNPASLCVSGANFTYAGSNWMELTFASPRNGKYMKLEISGSLNANDQVRIREINPRVIIINHLK